MPKVIIDKTDGFVMIHLEYTEPSRRVYLGKFTNEQYEALRNHFLEEFLSQPIQKYGHI